MRWDELFDDLEARLVEEDRRDLEAEVADRTRRERALLGLQDRLSANQGGRPITVRVTGAGTVVGRVTGVGADWVLVAERPQQPVLIAFAAIRTITGASARSEQVGAVAKAFGLGSALVRSVATGPWSRSSTSRGSWSPEPSTLSGAT